MLWADARAVCPYVCGAGGGLGVRVACLWVFVLRSVKFLEIFGGNVENCYF